jgi:hypothetical protein
MNARPHCSCEDVQNISTEEAAARLGCRERLLKENLRRIPHMKFGDQRVLCPCELRIAMRLFTVVPAVPAVEAEPADATNAVTRLRSVKPSGAKRSKRAG